MSNSVSTCTLILLIRISPLHLSLMFILFSIHDEKYRQIEYILKLQDSIKETSGLPELPIVVCWRQWTPLICNRADAAHRIHQTLYICCLPLAQGSNHMPFSSHPPYNQQENLTSINSKKIIIIKNQIMKIS